MVAELADSAGMSPGRRLTPVARMRFRGQGHELEVAFDPGDDVAALVRHFAERHQARYGFVLPADPQVVSVRATVSDDALPVALARTEGRGWDPATGWDDGGLAVAVVPGRHVIALPDATLLVAHGWTARTLPIGGWLVERDA